MSIRPASTRTAVGRIARTVGVCLCLLAGCSLWATSAFALREHVFNTSFGAEGSEPGQLKEPSAVAVNEVALGHVGEVYVLDSGNNRVQWFSPGGAEVKGEFNGEATPATAFSIPDAIAIDNSTNPLDPSAGDVYVADRGNHVVDKFGPEGKYLGQITSGNEGVAFNEIYGVAVDLEGVVWVYQATGEIDSFDNTLANTFLSSRQSPLGGTSPGFAVDAQDNLYVNQEARVIGKLSSTGELLNGALDGEESSAVAVDLARAEAYVDNLSSIGVFGPAGQTLERFGAGQLASGAGMATDSATGVFYVADVAANTVHVFDAIVVPGVSTGAASGVSEAGATLNGSVNPDSVPVTTCTFEYGTATEPYEHTAECAQAVGGGASPVPVSVSLTGLSPSTLYHYRLTAANANGPGPAGEDRTFSTGAVIDQEDVIDVTSTAATLQAQINPNGTDTHYYFQYGTNAAYGSRSPAAPGADLGSAEADQPANVHVQGLQPGVEYHYRVVAVDANGITVNGPDHTFTTPVVPGAQSLPDGRAYEMASPVDKNGADVLVPRGTRIAEVEGSHLLGSGQAAEDGHAVAYATSIPLETPRGNPSVTSDIYSVRTAAGWTSATINPPTNEAPGVTHSGDFEVFSPDLARGLLTPGGRTPLAPTAPAPSASAPEGYYDSYIWSESNDSYQPLIESSPLLPANPDSCNYDPTVANVTSDLAAVVFFSHAALTENAVPSPTCFFRTANLFEWSSGKLDLVNILPSGVSDGGNSALGWKGERTRHAVSAEGSRVYFTSKAPGAEGLYLREGIHTSTPRTIPVPGGEPFNMASADGSRVFLGAEPEGGTNVGEGLLVFEPDAGAEGQLTDLSSGGGARGIVDASEDGSYVYFVSAGALAGDAVAGRQNLYLAHYDGGAWSTRFITALANEDSGAWEYGAPGLPKASQVSPDGRYLAFGAYSSLTHYDNADAKTDSRDQEVFLYDESSGHLTCVSCNPSGARPSAASTGPAKFIAASLPSPRPQGGFRDWIYRPRAVFEDGRVLFDSSDGLVPQDTNGKLDVYEWEPGGIGTCHGVKGCVYLISGGTGSANSSLVDASRGGSDIFFVTSDSLLSRDVDNSFDLYDARECTSASPCLAATAAAPPPCASSDACLPGAAAQPPIFGAPSSATFAGAGNVSAPPSANGRKPKTAAQVRAQNLAKALRRCRRKHNRHRRRICQSQAHKRYGAKTKTKTSAIVNRRAK